MPRSDDPYNQWVVANPAWFNSSSSATTYTYSTNTTMAPVKATVTFQDVPVAPAPKTQVERLLADVEGVCALAR